MRMGVLDARFPPRRSLPDLGSAEVSRRALTASSRFSGSNGIATVDDGARRSDGPAETGASMRTMLARELASAQRPAPAWALFLDFLGPLQSALTNLGQAVGGRAAAPGSRPHHGEPLRTGDAVARSGGDEFTVLAGNLPSARDAGTVRGVG